jgi:ABC-type uncharacterized transport system fused permease/ATPase subunit
MATVAVYALSVAGTQWLGAVIGLYWQKSFLGQFQDVYFKNKTLYAANKMVPSLDNMDQRIADDTRNFTQGMATFLFGSTNGVQGAVQVRLPRPSLLAAVTVTVADVARMVVCTIPH